MDFLLLPAVFVGDKLLKDRAEKKLGGSQEVLLLHRGVRLSLSLNHGATLNLGSRHPGRVRSYSLALTSSLSLVYVYFLMAHRGGLYRTALALALGGAWSNTFDRFSRGYVVDYVSFPGLGRMSSRLIGKKKGRFLGGIVFNISDFFIIAGELVAVWALISGETW